MIEPPRMADSKAQAAAVIHLTMPRDQIQRFMEPAIEELKAAFSEQGWEEAGPLFSHHLTLSSETFDFEVGIPVKGRVHPVGRVNPGELPAAQVARTIYHGPYEGLFSAWDEFGKRVTAELGELIAGEGLERSQTLWECYISGPESNPDPSTWQTELNLPFVKE